MRIFLRNAIYRRKSTSGGSAHIKQFIDNSLALGHEVWSSNRGDHELVKVMPRNFVRIFHKIRQMSVLYHRVEWRPPYRSKFEITHFRKIIGNPIIVWEFNTVPEYGLIAGYSKKDVEKSIQLFKRYAHECDLAICVSSALADYVNNKLGIKHVKYIPNGSDPDLFSPDVPYAKRMTYNNDRLNVVWLGGSAELAWHNLKILQETANLLWEWRTDSKISFHIIGQIKNLMTDMPPNVNYYGAYDYNALPNWLSGMDVGLCLYNPGPANYCSPLKLFDYMSSGLTVVSTYQPQVQEIFEELGQQDLLIPTDNARMLADVLMNLASNMERVRKLGDAGRQLIIKKYNWRRTIGEIFMEIEVLLRDRR